MSHCNGRYRELYRESLERKYRKKIAASSSIIEKKRNFAVGTVKKIFPKETSSSAIFQLFALTLILSQYRMLAMQSYSSRN